MGLRHDVTVESGEGGAKVAGSRATFTRHADPGLNSPANPTVRVCLKTPMAPRGTMAAGGVFAGIEFYLTRLLRPERREELRRLVTQNGGREATTLRRGAIEIVERAQLKPDSFWVAADFIEDSLRHGELQAPTRYMGPHSAQFKEMARRDGYVLVEEEEQRTAKRTPSQYKKAVQRVRYTVDEQAKMLQFVHEHYPNRYWAPSIPESVWKAAEEKQIIARSWQSMHEHCRKTLVNLTRKERDSIFEKTTIPNPSPRPQREAANDETEGDDEISGRAKKRQKSATRRLEIEEEHERTVDDAAQRKERRQQSNGHKDAPSQVVEDERDDSSQGEREDEEENADEPQQLSGHREGEELPQPPTCPRTRGSSDADTHEVDPGRDSAQDDRSFRSGEVFRSYWERVAADVEQRNDLERFFDAPVPAQELPPSITPVPVPTATPHRTPQRSRRLSHDTFTSTPLQRRRRSTGDTPSAHTPRTPAQAGRHELMTVLEEMVGQRMTPPRRKSLERLIPLSLASEDEASTIISKLQFQTGHDHKTVCSALYWSSGDERVAHDFLMGYLPDEYWSLKDDQLLIDLIRPDVTEVDIAGARRAGAFDTMRVKRSGREIIRRIQFLL